MNFFIRIKNVFERLILSWFLGASLIDKCYLFIVIFTFWFSRKFLTIKPVGKKIKLKKFGQTFDVIVENNGDLAVLREIFWLEEYKIDIKEEPKLIIDLGSNVGFSAIYFKLKYPKAKIYAFEPEPEVFKRLKKNTSFFSDIICVNVAISSDDGVVNFYSYPESSMSSSLIKRLPGQEAIQVPARSIDSLINENNWSRIDLIKFDIEGAEDRVFKSFLNKTIVSRLIGEIHLDLMSSSEADFIELFQKDFLIKSRPISSRRLIVDIIHQ